VPLSFARVQEPLLGVAETLYVASLCSRVENVNGDVPLAVIVMSSAPLFCSTTEVTPALRVTVPPTVKVLNLSIIKRLIMDRPVCESAVSHALSSSHPAVNMMPNNKRIGTAAALVFLLDFMSRYYTVILYVYGAR